MGQWGRFRPIASALLLLLVLATAANAAGPRALLVFDGKAEASADGYMSARYIANLLGHFQIQYELRPLEAYRRGELNSYDYVFFAPGTPRPKFPAGFLDELGARQGPTVWLGRYIELFLTPERTASLGFGFIDYRDDEGVHTVTYKNVVMPKGDPDLNLVKVLDASKVRTYATAQNEDKQAYPYVLRSGNFWYFADCPFSYVTEGDRYLVFCDLLHDIVGQAHGGSRRAMVRIEDVSVDDDPQDLRTIADYLYSQGVPFQIALIPIFRDPDRGLKVYLSDRKDFVDAVKYMVSRGGSVVMHGVTHQYRGVSADDYEFWNDVTDRPVPNDGNKDSFEAKLKLAFTECFANGIYPISWETPHNAGSPNTYALLKDHFSVFHERELATPTLASEQYFPYPTTDAFGRFIVPENLGYVPVALPGEVQTIKPSSIVDRARAMLAVRDGIATFYFHTFMPLSYLKEMVKGIRGLGYEYISLREFAPQVRFQHWQVAVAGADGRVALQPGVINKPYAHRVVIGPGGEIQEDTSPARGEVSRALRVPKGAIVAWEGTDASSLPQRAAQPSLLARLKNWVSGSETVGPPVRAKEFPKVSLLWNPAARNAALREQETLEHLARTYGFAVERLPFRVATEKPFAAIAAVPADRLVIIPAHLAAQLSPEQQTLLLDYLRAGGKLLLAGRSPLAERLGIEYGDHSIQVNRVTDSEYPERLLRWEPAVEVERFEPPSGYITLMTEPESRQVLAFSAPFGQGEYVYLATPPNSDNPAAASTRYPYLANHLYGTFRAQPRVTRPALEAYFEPGGYQDGLNLNRLVDSWRKVGIRKVHVAAWHFFGQWTWPYQTLIDLCHRDGIAVYAWFEFPMVTTTFWNANPAWREITATGADHQVGPGGATLGTAGWRFLMNLRNPDAMKAALAFFRDTVNRFDWDGVNLAELNFDSGADPMEPQRFMPMNADVRAEFRAVHGFDPILLFDAKSPYFWRRNPAALKTFADYRVQLVTNMHRAFLDELQRIPKSHELETVVTMLDSLHSKTLGLSAGVDSLQIVRLMDRYPFTLEVQDPAEYWAASPDRYLQFGKTYSALVRDPARLMFDVNVVNRDVSHTTLTSPLATGDEFAGLLAAASAPTGRAIFYAEHTVTPQDWQLAASVLARGARVTERPEGWLVEAPFAVALRTSTTRANIYLDGRPWPVFDSGSVLVPRGTHLLTYERPFSSLLDFEQLDLRMRSISGELLAADATSRGMTFDYSSRGRCLVVFNKQPYRVLVDGNEWKTAPLFAHGEWSLPLPSGKHTVEVVANAPAVFAVDATSLLFSSFIVLFGLLSCGMMLAIYFFIRFRRAAEAWRNRGTPPIPEATL